MKLTHTVADHRPMALTKLTLYREDENHERQTLAVEVYGVGQLMIPAHWVWGVEVDYEVIGEVAG